MSILADKKEAKATDVWFSDDMIFVRLSDGREVGAPIAWFPRLKNATEKERKNWRLVGNGIGIHWQDIDEDFISWWIALNFPRSAI